MPRGIPNEPTKRKATVTPEPAPSHQIPADGYTLPGSMTGQRGAALLLDACNVFGVNPDMTTPIYQGRGRGPFRELLNWKFYPGNEAAGIPDSVVVVTIGGVKIRYYTDPDFPMDPDTENRLRHVFHAWKMNPKTNEVEPIPLPDDLTLPRSAVTSQVDPNAGHRYASGYLRRSKDDPRNT